MELIASYVDENSVVRPVKPIPPEASRVVFDGAQYAVYFGDEEPTPESGE
jgi:hypothetical protein